MIVFFFAKQVTVISRITLLISRRPVLLSQLLFAERGKRVGFFSFVGCEGNL